MRIQSNHLADTLDRIAGRVAAKAPTHYTCTTTTPQLFLESGVALSMLCFVAFESDLFWFRDGTPKPIQAFAALWDWSLKLICAFVPAYFHEKKDTPNSL
jgi:hypothetical protein